jgi:SpoVK/Ycf46/Vps4 family AAA+-type ATPase
MDVSQKLQVTKDKTDKAKKQFMNPKSPAQQHEAINSITEAIEFLKAIQAYYTIPQFQQQLVKTMISTEENNLKMMLEFTTKNGTIVRPPKNQNQAGNQKPNESQSKIQNVIVTEKPGVAWEDISGLNKAKKALKEAVIMPTRFPKFFNEVVKPWNGILLYGPPGTGKTTLAKACATECDATFYQISAADIISKWFGESEKQVKALFTEARSQTSAIIFFDEIDA